MPFVDTSALSDDTRDMPRLREKLEDDGHANRVGGRHAARQVEIDRSRVAGTLQLMIFSVLACGGPLPSTTTSNEPANRLVAGAVMPSEVLCCCELAPPNEPRPFESRASACTLGTPATPAGTCVDWTRCGFTSTTVRTIADRPDLASSVKVAPGMCCCDLEGSFGVAERTACRECLDADWCVADKREHPPLTAPGPWIDRCAAIAEHFEPWRKRPEWAAEVSPRATLIADCRRDRWSNAMQSCLLGANSPLELDGCIP